MSFLPCRYKYIMMEVERACDNFISDPRHHPGGKFQFMDVCCCPGGFSEYFLHSVPHGR
jgi:hypothetical protein